MKKIPVIDDDLEVCKQIKYNLQIEAVHDVGYRMGDKKDTM